MSRWTPILFDLQQKPFAFVLYLLVEKPRLIVFVRDKHSSDFFPFFNEYRRITFIELLENFAELIADFQCVYCYHLAQCMQYRCICQLYSARAVEVWSGCSAG